MVQKNWLAEHMGMIIAFARDSEVNKRGVLQNSCICPANISGIWHICRNVF